MTFRLNKLATSLFLVLLCIFSSSAFAQQRTITGTVTGENNAPVAGATITVKGTSIATLSNQDGQFSITVPADRNALTVSFVGYQNQDIPLGNSNIVNISLKSSTASLEEVVVTGYATQRKKDLTGSVAVVNVDELKSQPAASPVEALQGKATGVQIINDGAPGSTPQIRIRGFSTINNNDPLYIIDGMPYKGKLSWLSAEDIASMQVLKDASAASIYGSRANNGVVIITTRKGRKGSAPKVSLNAYYGTQAPNRSRFPDFMSPTQYANYFYQQFINAGQTPGLTSTTGTNYGTSATAPQLPEYLVAGTKTGHDITAADADPSKYNYSQNPSTYYQITKANQQGTDWMRVITQNAPMQNYELSVLGGGDNSTYAISGNYFKQEGTIKYSGFERAVVRANTSFSTLNDHLTIGENMQYSYDKNQGFATNRNVSGEYQGEGSPIGWVYRMQTIIPVYDIMGNFAGTRGDKLGNSENPLAVLYRARNNISTDNQFFGSAYADLMIVKGLNLKTTFGMQYNNFKWQGFTVPNPEFSEGSIDRNSIDEHQGYGSSWTWTNTLTYKRNFNEVHNLTILAGTEAIKNKGRTLDGFGNGYFLYGNTDYYTLGTASSTSAGSSGYTSSLYSLFGRVDYSFKDRYLLSGTIRRDGSSNFSPDERYGVFPAGSVAWRLSQEEFMKGISWLNDLKIRAGFGITGNQDIPSFQYLRRYQASINTSYYPISGAAPQSGLWVNSYDNPNIKWEQAQSLNIGLDFTIINNKLEGSFDWYNRDTKDMLYPVPQPATGVGGGSSPYLNIGKMNNRGVELSLTYHYTGSGKEGFTFDLTGNISTNKNKIVELAPGIPFVQYNTIRAVTTSILYPGYAFGSFYGYKMIGIYQSQDEVTKGPSYADARVGGPKYADISGPDGNPDVIVDANDRTIIGNPMPKFIYSLGFNASYKRFDISMFFNASVGNDLFDMTRYYTDFGGFDGAVTTRMLNAWSPENPSSMIPSPYRGRPNIEMQASSYYVQNGSFFKMKNLQIGYNFPMRGTLKNAISNLRAYVSATNLFVITDYSGMDPEVSQISSTYSAPGVDIGVVPMSRQFIFGVNVTF